MKEKPQTNLRACKSEQKKAAESCHNHLPHACKCTDAKGRNMTFFRDAGVSSNYSPTLLRFIRRPNDVEQWLLGSTSQPISGQGRVRLLHPCTRLVGATEGQTCQICMSLYRVSILICPLLTTLFTNVQRYL
jgi:hypothetical protein